MRRENASSVQEHTPWTSGSFDYRNALAREPVPSAQDDRTKSKPKKNASLGHRQQPCRPEEAQALATRGLADEGSTQLSTLAGRQMQKGAPRSRRSRCGYDQHPNPESNRVGRTFLSAAVAVRVGFRAYRRSDPEGLSSRAERDRPKDAHAESRDPESVATHEGVGREFSARS